MVKEAKWQKHKKIKSSQSSEILPALWKNCSRVDPKFSLLGIRVEGEFGDINNLYYMLEKRVDKENLTVVKLVLS